MGELQIVELADALDQGRFKESLPSIRGIFLYGQGNPYYRLC